MTFIRMIKFQQAGNWKHMLVISLAWGMKPKWINPLVIWATLLQWSPVDPRM